MGLFKSKDERRIEREMRIRQGVRAIEKSIRQQEKFSEDFINFSNDAVKMDASLHALANDFLKVDEVLHKLDVTTIPTPEDTTTRTAATDQLHQILHAAHDFMLV